MFFYSFLLPLCGFYSFLVFDGFLCGIFAVLFLPFLEGPLPLACCSFVLWGLLGCFLIVLCFFCVVIVVVVVLVADLVLFVVFAFCAVFSACCFHLLWRVNCRRFDVALCCWSCMGGPFLLCLLSALLVLFLVVLVMIYCCFLFLLSCVMFSAVMFLPFVGYLIAVAVVLFCALRLVWLIPSWSAFSCVDSAVFVVVDDDLLLLFVVAFLCSVFRRCFCLFLA